MIKLLLILIFSISHIFAEDICTLLIPEKIITSQSNDIITRWSFPQNNCSEETLLKLNSFFVNFEGETQVELLTQILTSEFKTPIKIQSTSDKIEVIPLHIVIKNYFSQITHYSIQAQFSHSSPLIGLSKSDEIKLSCDLCQFTNSENMSLTIVKAEAVMENIAIRARFEKMMEAYEVIQPIHAFEENIPATSLRKRLIPFKTFQNAITDLSHLNFYRTNKMLKSGDILTKNDVSLISLVRAGEKTEIIFNNNGLTLKTFGIARQHGGYDEFVEVINPQNQKKFLGRVIDNKKIVVDL